MCLPLRAIDMTAQSKAAARFIYDVKTKRIGQRPEFCLALAELLSRNIDITTPEFMDQSKRYLNTDFAVKLKLAIGLLNETFYLDMERVARYTMQLLNFRIDVMLGNVRMLFSVKPYLDGECCDIIDPSRTVEDRGALYNECYLQLSEILATLK